MSIKVAQLIGKRELPYRISKEVSRHPMFASLSNRLIEAAELHLEPTNKAVDLCKFVHSRSGHPNPPIYFIKSTARKDVQVV